MGNNGMFRRTVGVLFVVVFACMTGLCASFPACGADFAEKGAAVADSLRSGNFRQEYVRNTFLALKGDFWGAIEGFRKLASEQPGNAAVRYSLAKAFYALSVPDSARVHGEAALKIEPENTHYLRFLAGLARDMQEHERAAGLYGAAWRVSPGHQELLQYQAFEYMAADRPLQALEVFQQLLHNDPLNESFLSQVLWLQIRLKQHEGAIDTVNRLLREGKNPEKMRLILGELYMQSGRKEDAVKILKELLSTSPQIIPARIALFDAYIQQERPQEYLLELRDFYNTVPMDASRKIDIARLFLVRSEKDSLYIAPAALMVNEIIAHHPRDGRVWLLKGEYQMRHGDRTNAIVSLEKALRLRPREITAWEDLVIANIEMNRKRQAFAIIEKARRVVSGQALRLSVLEGYALFRTGSPKKAAALLETALRSGRAAKAHSEVLVQGHITLAMAYDQMGVGTKSFVEYEKVLSLDPHNTLAMNNLAYLLSEKENAEKDKALQRALKLAGDAVSLEPDNGVYLDTLGWVHFRLGNYTIARDILQKAIDSGIDEAEVFRHFGEVYEKLGDPARAKEMFDKARSME